MLSNLMIPPIKTKISQFNKVKMPYITFEHTLDLYFSSSPASLYQNIQKPPKSLETDISCAEGKTFSLSLEIKESNAKQKKILTLADLQHQKKKISLQKLTGSWFALASSEKTKVTVYCNRSGRRKQKALR